MNIVAYNQIEGIAFTLGTRVFLTCVVTGLPVDNVYNNKLCIYDTDAPG